MPEPVFFHLITQGCKINQYESQALVESWQAQGAAEVGQVREAEVVVINSCAVTERAVQDLRKWIRRCARDNPRARIVVTGCAAQVCAAQISSLPEVDLLVPQADKSRLLGWPPGQPERMEASETGLGFPPFLISRFTRARPVLKVQDGCSHGCTYCIVPKSRGPARSRDPQQVLQEAKRLLINGFRELVLCGINLAQYRIQGMDFWDLVQYLERSLAPRWGEVARLRLSSLDPSQLQDKALTVLGTTSMVCPHLHVSMQSGSERVLQDMGRGHYRPQDVAEFFRKLRSVWPCFALGGDFLVGFPGESEADMQETASWFARQPFTYAHVFAYSPRPGTAAAVRSDQVRPEVKKERSRYLRSLAAQQGQQFVHSMQARARVSVLLEEHSPGAGHSEHYVPCTFVQAPQAEVATCVPAVPVQADGSRLLVRPA